MSYYVTARDGGRVAYLAGPYRRHGDAVRMVEPCRDALAELMPTRAPWVAIGTARRRADHAKRPNLAVATFLADRGYTVTTY